MRRAGQNTTTPHGRGRRPAPYDAAGPLAEGADAGPCRPRLRGAGPRPALGPDRAAAGRHPRRLGCCCGRPGRRAAVHQRRADRAAAQPVRDAAAARRVPRGVAVAGRTVVVIVGLVGIGPARATDRRPGRARSSATSRASWTPTATLADLQDWLDGAASTSRSREGDRARDDRRARVRRRRRGRQLHPRGGRDPRRGEPGADPDHRAVDLHADLRRSDRRDRARRRAARRRDARRRLPDRVQPAVFGYVRGRSCSRRSWARARA